MKVDRFLTQARVLIWQKLRPNLSHS